MTEKPRFLVDGHDGKVIRVGDKVHGYDCCGCLPEVEIMAFYPSLDRVLVRAVALPTCIPPDAVGCLFVNPITHAEVMAEMQGRTSPHTKH